MKTYRLIKTQDKFLLVSDEEIQINDNYIAWETNYATEPKERWVIYNRVSELNGTNQKKIILASPDFSLLKEEDCKKIRYVDVEKLVLEAFKQGITFSHKEFSDTAYNRFRTWFSQTKTAQSHNDKQFSLKNMEKSFISGGKFARNIQNPSFDEIIQSLQQTSWDVEVEMDKIPADRAPNGWDEFPKIVNGKIKIIKIL